MPTPGFDAERARDFAARMQGILNAGALALMVSLGHRAGLFDVMRRLDFATAEEIADAAGLCERYVREWLGSVATGGLVELDAERGAYRLPPEHAAALTRDAQPHSFAVTAQWIPLLARVEDEILACFETGGGLPTSAYLRFHQVMAEQSDQTTVAPLLEHILPLVPGALARLREGVDVLDAGCGAGRALHRLAREFPRSRFLGVDLCAEAIAGARAEAAHLGLANLRFERADVARLYERERFDLILAFDTVHDHAQPEAGLAALARALRPGGALLMQEPRATGTVAGDHVQPLAPFLYAVSCLHCTSVSLAQEGRGLGAMWGEARARRLLVEAGFAEPSVHALPHDPVNHYYVARLAT